MTHQNDEFTPFEVEAEGETDQSSRARSLPARGSGGLTFIKSLPLVWIRRAAVLPGRALHLALALKLQADLERSDRIRVQRKLVASFGLDRYAEARALAELERAGLITVRRARGRRPVISIVAARESSGTSARATRSRRADR